MWPAIRKAKKPPIMTNVHIPLTPAFRHFLFLDSSTRRVTPSGFVDGGGVAGVSSGESGGSLFPLLDASLPRRTLAIAPAAISSMVPFTSSIVLRKEPPFFLAFAICELSGCVKTVDWENSVSVVPQIYRGLEEYS